MIIDVVFAELFESDDAAHFEAYKLSLRYPGEIIKILGENNGLWAEFKDGCARWENVEFTPFIPPVEKVNDPVVELFFDVEIFKPSPSYKDVWFFNSSKGSNYAKPGTLCRVEFITTQTDFKTWFRHGMDGGAK